jgi:rhodanese-related sulfurtransferase
MKEKVVHPDVAITPRELQQRLQQQLPTELLDVRTRPEFAAVHLQGARLVPLDELDAKRFLSARANDGEPLFVLCQSGNRARKAIARFAEAGFTNCVLLEGGMQACIEEGLAVERGSSGVLPLLQQVHLIIGVSVFFGALLALTFDSRVAVIPLIAGAGLIFNGVTGKCGLALVLAKMPWNKGSKSAAASCCQVTTHSSTL